MPSPISRQKPSNDRVEFAVIEFARFVRHPSLSGRRIAKGRLLMT
jgi:hypothetical protein